MEKLKLLFVTMLLLGIGFYANAQKLIDHVDEKYPDVKNIQVQAVFCDVNLEPGESDQVHFKGEIRGLRVLDGYSINVLKSGNLLKVMVQHPNNMRGNIKGLLNFRVPEGISLEINTVSGNVKVMKTKSPEMNLKTVSGNVLVNGTGDDAVLQTVSGNVSAKVSAGNLSVKTVSGNQEISDVNGDLSSHSTSGNINLSMVNGRSDIKTASGHITSENLMKGASFKTFSGKIKINVLRENSVVKTVSGDVELNDFTGGLNFESTSGDLKGRKIVLTDNCSFKSVSGDVDLDMENEPEMVGAKLKSGSGSLAVGTIEAEKKLILDRGNINISGASISGDMKFY